MYPGHFWQWDTIYSTAGTLVHRHTLHTECCSETVPGYVVTFLCINSCLHWFSCVDCICHTLQFQTDKIFSLTNNINGDTNNLSCPSLTDYHRMGCGNLYSVLTNYQCLPSYLYNMCHLLVSHRTKQYVVVTFATCLISLFVLLPQYQHLHLWCLTHEFSWWWSAAPANLAKLA